MKKFYYEFAGVAYAIHVPAAWISPHLQMLEKFLSRELPTEYRTLEFEPLDILPEPEGELVFTGSDRCVYRLADTLQTYIGGGAGEYSGAYLCIRRQGVHSHVYARQGKLPYGITAKVILRAMEAEHAIVCQGGVLLHAAWIDYNGRAILFTAPSGVGKSTQAQLWCDLHNAKLMNGDRVAVRVQPEGVFACGIPFCGSSGVAEAATQPVAAVVYLSQSRENQVRRLRGVEVFKRVWEGCAIHAWSKDDVEQATQTVLQVVQEIPVFHLSCTPDEGAVFALEKALQELR